MCGIVGYSGQAEQVVPTLLSGLRRLEYRGYDSSGIAIQTDDLVAAHKAVGKIIELEESMPEGFGTTATGTGIAHTRWATHGGATKLNAHPHASYDGKIWVVHNGIIENHQQIKDDLKKDGIECESETDTEVIAHLIARYYSDDLRAAMLAAVSELHGAFALAVISADEPGRLIGVKFASPLVLGVGQSELILASDAAAIVDRTKQVVYLEDGELVDIMGHEFEIVTFDNAPRTGVVMQLEWDHEQASKQGYPHYLLKEIMEQPQAIIDATRGRIDFENATVRFGGLLDKQKEIQAAQSVTLLGVGTSFYSALLGELYFEALANIPAKAVLAPEYRYRDKAPMPQSWVIALSQSGETADTLAAIEEAKRQGSIVTGIVNTVGSSIARVTDAGVYNHIGPEISVASTKAFTSQAVILLMHAILLGRHRGLDVATANHVLAAIQQLPEQINSVFDQSANIKAIAERYQSVQSMFFIARDLQYPVALEAALKLKEISYIHAEGLSAGELKHGFIALADKNMPAVAIVPSGFLRDKLLANIEELRARTSPVIAVSNSPVKGLDNGIVVPDTGSRFTQPIVDTVALQLLAYHAAVALGRDVDQPRNLAKSVTVE